MGVARRGRATGYRQPPRSILHRPQCGTTCMGCEDYIVQLPQGRVRRQRLNCEDVETSTSQMAGEQSLGQSFFVHDRTASRIDEYRTALHPGECGAVDQSLRIDVQRSVDAHDVALAQEHVEVDPLGLG